MLSFEHTYFIRYSASAVCVVRDHARMRALIYIDARYWYKFTRLRVIRSIFARSVQFSSSSCYFLVLYNYEEPNSSMYFTEEASLLS